MTNLKWKRRNKFSSQVSRLETAKIKECLTWLCSNSCFVRNDGYMDYWHFKSWHVFFHQREIMSDRSGRCIYYGERCTNDVDFVSNLLLGMLKYFPKYISNSPSHRYSDKIIFILAQLISKLMIKTIVTKNFNLDLIFLYILITIHNFWNKVLW